MTKKRFLAAFTALLITASLCACSKNKSEDSSDKENSVKTAANSSSDDSGSLTADQEVEQGELIKKAYEKFGENYTLKERITDNNNKSSTVTLTVKGDDFCRMQETSAGKSGTLKAGEEAYDFDYVCAMYKTAEEPQSENMIKAVVDNKLPQTKTHISEDDLKDYDVEEYTYAGGTYMTVLDFCFDKNSGELVKYHVCYITEGNDDLVQTREITDISDKADSELLNLGAVKALTDFEKLDAEKRLEFCKNAMSKTV